MHAVLRPQLLHKGPADALSIVKDIAELGAALSELQHRCLRKEAPTIIAKDRDTIQSFTMSGECCEGLISQGY